MPIVDTPSGRVEYRAFGPEDSAYPPVVLIHGLLVNGELWDGVAERLAARGYRCIVPNLPLGAHTVPFGADADRTPRGVARLIRDMVATLDLTDVTLVGNDTGGALCQFLIDDDPSAIGRLVLTNCDAFDKFPPPPFNGLVVLGRSPGRVRVLAKLMRPAALRHSMLGFGGLVSGKLDPDLTARWLQPLADGAIRDDVAAFMRGIDKRDLLDVSTRLDRFRAPVLLLWGEADRFFKPSFARRLEQVFPDARLVLLPGARTFVSLDAPERVADEITAFATAAR